MSNRTNSDTQAAESESKYIYFILAASGGALGFTLEKHAQAQGLTVTYSVLLLATFSWLLSFLFGLRAIQHRITSLNLLANAEQIEVALQMARKNMAAIEIKPFEAQFAETIENTNNALDLQGKRFNSYVMWQFRLLMLGSVAYTAFHLFPLLQFTL